MRSSVLSLLLIATACAPSPDRVIDEVEAEVRMPADAGPLTQYRRYYYRDGRRIIGMYRRSTSPGREWITKEHRKLVFDGGCGVVNLAFSLETHKVISIGCNGVA